MPVVSVSQERAVALVGRGRVVEVEVCEAGNVAGRFDLVLRERGEMQYEQRVGGSVA